MLRDEEALRGRIPRDRDRVADAARIAVAIALLRLRRFVRVEAPNRSLPLTQRARVLTRRFRRAHLFLTSIGRTADVHVDVALIVEIERLHRMLTLLGQAVDENGVLTCGLQLSRRHSVAQDGLVGPEIKVVIVDIDPRPVMIPELRPLVRAPVAVRVAKRYNAAILAFPKCHIDIAVLGDIEMAGPGRSRRRREPRKSPREA